MAHSASVVTATAIFFPDSRFMICLLLLDLPVLSVLQIKANDAITVGQLFTRSFQHYSSSDHNHESIGYPLDQTVVLLHQQDRQSVRAQVSDDFHQFIHDDRCKALGR